MPASKFFGLTSAYIESLHDEGIAITWPRTEPVGSFDCLDLNLLESAAKQPFQCGFGIDFYPTIYDKAACLFFSIAGGHIFSNGNKRTAVLALDQFLYANSIYIYLSNTQMRNLAKKTASYRTRGENHKDVIASLSKRIKANSFPFRMVREADPQMYRWLHSVKNKIHSYYLNAHGTRPRQYLATRH